MKNNIRKSLLELRRSLSEDEVKNKSKIIVEKIRKTDSYKASKVVGLYCPIKNEVDLLELFNDSKTICLPRVCGNDMEFYIVNSLNDLHLGAFNVLEPNFDLKKVDKNDMDIIYVPCVGMSKDLYRIGYGKGFYDRYLNDYKGLKIAVCYRNQIVEDVYNEPHDVRLDDIIFD